jgi:hypothetical protein
MSTIKPFDNSKGEPTKTKRLWLPPQILVESKSLATPSKTIPARSDHHGSASNVFS